MAEKSKRKQESMWKRGPGRIVAVAHPGGGSVIGELGFIGNTAFQPVRRMKWRSQLFFRGNGMRECGRQRGGWNAGMRFR